MGLKFRKGSLKQKIDNENVFDITGYSESQILSFTGANSLGREISTMNISGIYPNLNVYSTTDDFYMLRILDFQTGIIINNNFELNDLKKRGGGIGTSVLVAQVRAASSAGFNKINLHAGQIKKTCNGYYSWGVMGFKMVGESIAEFQQFIKRHMRKDENLAELLSTQKGRDFWKAKGFAWDGEFDLKDGSDCRKTLDAYKTKWPWALTP